MAMARAAAGRVRLGEGCYRVLPGQYYDSETGKHYNYFRDYDPNIGRYIQSDPIGLDGGLNTFGYAYDNPLIFYDAEGKVAAQTVVFCVAGALTAYGVSPPTEF